MRKTAKYSLEGIIASIIFLVLLVVVLVQIFGRTGIIPGPVWTEEVARWLWVWMAFIAIGEVERKNAQLNMGFLTELLPPSARRWLFVVIDLVYLAVMCNLCWIGYKTVLRTWNNASVTIPTTDAVLYASAFVASFLIIFRVAQRLIANNSSPEIQGDRL